MIKVVYKYGTGQEVPEGAVYLTTIKNGKMIRQEVFNGRRNGVSVSFPKSRKFQRSSKNKKSNEKAN